MKREIMLAVIFFALSVSSFSDVSLAVDIFVGLDGTAHVVEQTQISMNSEQEVYTYTTSMGAIKTTLDDWKKLTNSEFLTYHTTAAPIQQKVFPQKPIYNSAVQKYYSTIILEYDTAEPILVINETGPRVRLYKLDSSKIAFQLSPTGDIVLPKSQYLRITIPSEARLVSANPKPDQTANNTLIWEGPYALGKLDLRFEIEKSLGDEVQEFFTSLASNIQFVITSYYFIIITLLAIFVAYKLKG